ncbi:glucose dehydrogenase [FAD, quinone]-like [Hermetia illucens]|uniref:glucose dehydrogenase [FAD, quinone]-like n=1 Tax=Hermetia illucens TaxID=343691 RepID=UPI0018CC14E2|nr:glucose dehydrogenase [FAD, quinone]-like [Hermetia illucens]
MNLFVFFVCYLALVPSAFGSILYNGLPSIMSTYLEDILNFGNESVISVQKQIVGPKTARQVYDFIIVGSGPAGSVIANRLTENPQWNVLLIETGGVENLFHEIPALAAFLQGTSSNWNYKSTPQYNACYGMNNNECALPRGKVLGGTSAINYMIYNRGNRRDFDRWAAAGNVGWSYREVLPYFLKSERANLRAWRNSPYHNTQGLLSTEDVPYRSGMVGPFVQAGVEAGLNEVDYNGESQVGISFVQANTLRGRRHSAARAFLKPIQFRPNLHVMINTRVTKVLINPVSKEAYGVEYSYKKKRYEVGAKREVILSAGAFNSPQLLMLSGIGPQEHLNQLQIPLIKDLPVGKLLYDHMSHFGPTFILNSTGNTLLVSDLNVNDFKQYIKGRGRLTLIGGVEALAFVKTPNSEEPPDMPDVELIFVPGSFASDQGTGLKRGANVKDDVYDTVFKQLETIPQDHFSTLIMLFHPKSVGYIHLRDKNPFHWPIIDPQYFTRQEDVETLLYGIKAAIRLSQSPALQRLGARLHDTPLPQCREHHFGSDNYWRCSIRTLSYTLHHQVATCKMGIPEDPTTVVNPQLQVHGILRLRVADTSVIPFPPTSHTNAMSVMIGEKTADMIKDTWKWG